MSKPHTLNQSLRVRISEEQLAQLQAIAERDDRSVGAVARRAIREMLERDRNGKP